MEYSLEYTTIGAGDNEKAAFDKKNFRLLTEMILDFKREIKELRIELES